MATIREVARAAGVSIATVSRVYTGSPHVAEATRRRVDEAAATLDFWPNNAARSLITNRSHALGVLLPDLYGEFFSEVIRGIDRAARREKLQVLISSSHANTEELTWAARSMHGRIDGLIAMAPDKASVEALRPISRNLRVLLLNPWSDLHECDTICIDNFGGARAVVAHLLRHGHREIATIRGPKGNIDAEERFRGYESALAEAGLALRPGLTLTGDFTEASGYRLATGLLRRRPRPSAVFCGNDSMAVGLLSGLREAGVPIPQEMAVVGFDDIAISQYTSPPLTTVKVSAFELGEKAVNRCTSPREGADRSANGKREVLATSLVLRASCGSGDGTAGGSARCSLLSGAGPDEGRIRKGRISGDRTSPGSSERRGRT